MRRIYLDHNATTPVRKEVAETISAALAVTGNPSSLHAFGRAAAALRDEARDRVAAAAGTRPAAVVFTSGGTEADNLALRGTLGAGVPPRIVTAGTEHEAILHTAEALRREGRADVEILPVDAAGLVDPAAVRRALGKPTGVVSIMAANNETGVLQPIAEIGGVCRDAGVLFHTDAVQCLGKSPFDFDALPVDLASVSAHKIGGPKGAGALLVREGVRLAPRNTGGGQERRVRPGTENLPGIAGFGRAAELAAGELEAERARLSALRDSLEARILSLHPGARVNGAGAPRLANTANVTFPGLDGETLLIALDLEGVAVSTGAACTAGAAEPSHVLRAMGRRPEEAQASIRFSLGSSTGGSDIEDVAEILARVVARLTGAGSPPRGVGPNSRSSR